MTASTASARPPGPLARWYATRGRHDLPWRAARDRWPVLVAEVMLHQTQVSRVRPVWEAFIDRFPTPEATAATPLGAVLRVWGRLGYPRRARFLWLAAHRIVAEGWPADLTELPGVGRYTAGAVAAQADGIDSAAVDVNIRRVLERVCGRRLGDREADAEMRRVGAPLRGRDRLLALMDLGALVCRPRAPRCGDCPLQRRCRSRGPLPPDRGRRQASYAGSLRQRRGQVLARLRSARRVAVAELDPEALDSLVTDGLAVRTGPLARLP